MNIVEVAQKSGQLMGRQLGHLFPPEIQQASSPSLQDCQTKEETGGYGRGKNCLGKKKRLYIVKNDSKDKKRLPDQ